MQKRHVTTVVTGCMYFGFSIVCYCIENEKKVKTKIYC